MKLKRKNVLFATGVTLLIAWILGGCGNNVALELSIFCAKLSLVSVVIWLSLDKE